MEINKELVEQQKTNLLNQQSKLAADLNACRGALQVLEYLLNHLNKQEEKVNDEGKVG